MANPDFLIKLMTFGPKILNKKVLYGLIGITALLIILKASSVIDWSWWLVTLPIWLPLSLAFILLVFLVFKFRALKKQMGGPQKGKRK